MTRGRNYYQSDSREVSLKKMGSSYNSGEPAKKIKSGSVGE